MRTIQTPAELDQLQPPDITLHLIRTQKRTVLDGVIVRDANGDVFQRDLENLDMEIDEKSRHACWWAVGTNRDDITTANLTFPVDVIWEPK